MLFMIWGYGGFIRTFLSARFWVPLARLSFAAYLWQSAVIVRTRSLASAAVSLRD